MRVPFFCLKFKRLSERAAKDTTPEPLSYFAVKSLQVYPLVQ